MGVIKMSTPENNAYYKKDFLIVGKLYQDNDGNVYRCVAYQNDEAVLRSTDSRPINTYFIFKYINSAWFDREDKNEFWLEKELSRG